MVNEVGLSLGTRVGHNHLTMCLIAYWLCGRSFLGLQVGQQKLGKVKGISVISPLTLHFAIQMDNTVMLDILDRKLTKNNNNNNTK